VRAVDHDLGHRLVGEHALERPVADDVVRDLRKEPLAVFAREALLELEPFLEVALDACADRAGLGAEREQLRPELVDQRQVEPVLQLGERIAAVGAGQRAGGLDALVQLHR
jgi:hypothetical protein